MGRSWGRRTHNEIGEVKPPYTVVLGRCNDVRGPVVHTVASISGISTLDSCCNIAVAVRVELGVDTLVTCLACTACRGCPACRRGYLNDVTMGMGKWTTADDRKLYPFQMDDMHLKNAIAKLYRDKERFKKNYVEWLVALQSEAAQRGIA